MITGAAPARPSSALLGAFVDALVAHPAEFVWDGARAGIDVRCTAALPTGLPNRARVKAFEPAPDVLLVFVYKDSQVPHSDDRFSYGALMAKRAVPAGAYLAAVLDWAVTGFHPERRPDVVRRTFPYTVPR